MFVLNATTLPFSDIQLSDVWIHCRPVGWRRGAQFHFISFGAFFLLFLFPASLPAAVECTEHGLLTEDPAGISQADQSRTSPDLYVLMTSPNITVRLAHPVYDCLTGEYCLDVEFQSDIPDQEIFGMNVRFFYEESTLELIDFRDFQGGYGPVAPNPPVRQTSPPAFGYNYFGFGQPGNGAAEWINGAIQLVDQNQPPVILATTGWTKLFQICFNVDDPDSTGFCPPIVWDLEQDPINGGYLNGDDGVVITVLDEQTGSTEPAFEYVDQFNWSYTGTGFDPPFGAPEPTDCITFSCGIEIDCPDDVTISCGESSLPSNTGMATSDDNCPGIPLITYTDSLIYGSCSQGNYILRTWMAIDSCNNHDTCVQTISIDDRGSICGAVFNDLGQPMGGIELRLMADVNMNASVDTGDILQATVFSDSLTGAYCFEQVFPCAYVIQEIQPMLFGDLADYDLTPDPDGNDSLDGPDNEIPVILDPCELDSQNHFVDIVCPTDFPVLPPDTLCENELIVLEIEDLNIGLLTYNWNFGSGATPSEGTGTGPHSISYVSTPENQSSGAHVELTIAKAGCPDTTSELCLIEVNPFPDASINGSTAQGCYYTDRIFQPVQPELPGATYQWDFGIGAVPATAAGYGPHTVYYTNAGPKVVSLVIHPNEPGAQCPDSSSLTFNIINCAAQIVGSVKSVSNNPIPGVNIRLYADADTNGLADNSNAIRSVFTNSAGNYSMATLTPGNYVMIQAQPSGWFSVDDGDVSNDGDIVQNTDSLDNLIPVTLMAGETDGGNYFIEGPISGSITGNTFIDQDGDQYPDESEGMGGILISIYTDTDINGIADSNIPVYTQLTDTTGNFSFMDIPVGHYVIVESQPAGYESVIDFDASNDGDDVPNANMVDDTIPLTLLNAEADSNNYFIEAIPCILTVTNTNDSGGGSLRQAIACAMDGDTIRFDSSLSGATILITSEHIVIDKQIVVYCNFEPRVNLSSQVAGFFNVLQYADIEFRGVNIMSGLAGSSGAAFDNYGTVTLCDLQLVKNPLLPSGVFMIYNHPASLLNVRGDCFFELD